MPVRYAKEKRVRGESALRAELIAELEHPKRHGEPDIVIEKPYPSTVHLYVIWKKWSNLEQMDRSRIILDAFTKVKGEEEANRVTVAMGLTHKEADALGVK